MRLFKTGLIALAALATLGASTSSLASTSSATLNLTLSFYDTDPLDAVGPSYSFLSVIGASRTGIDNPPSPSVRDDSDWISSTTNADGSANSFVNYQPTVSGQGAFVQYVLPVSGLSTTAWAQSYLYRLLELGAGTGVEVSASLSVDAQGLTPFQVAAASANVYLSDYHNSYQGPNLICCGFGESAIRSGSGSVSYENTGTQSTNIYIGSFATTQLISYNVAAVPEPETYALLMAGLGIVGASARRRKAKQNTYS